MSRWGIRLSGAASPVAAAENWENVFDDVVNELAPKFEAADGLVAASPAYYASANATLIAVLDRLLYSTHFDKNDESRGKCGLCTARWMFGYL